MTLDDVAPGLRAAYGKMPQLPLKSALFRKVVPLLMKLQRTPDVEGVSISVPGDGAPGLRLYVPDARKSDAALLWIHGGGYIIGAAKQDDALCAQTCRELGIVVVSAEYRLAPRHPFPAPLDDCHTVWRWMQAQAASLAIDPARIAIGGISAGGGLAAGLIQRVQDEDGPNAAAQWLFAPMLDDRTAARRELDAQGHFVWDNSLNELGWQSYLGREPGLADAPAYASPARRADFTGFPPAWIGVGAIELFFEEDADYARRMSEAGVDVTFEVVPGAPHGFEAWGAETEISRAHLACARNWLAARLS